MYSKLEWIYDAPHIGTNTIIPIRVHQALERLEEDGDVIQKK